MKPEELAGLLADHMKAQRKDWKRGGKLYISDLGWEGCPLSLWRKLKDYPQKEKTPGELLMFQQGENLEEQVANMLADVLAEHTDWELVDRQTSVEIEVDGETVTGKLDILMRNTKTGELLVLEVKSKRGRAFQYLDQPKDPNIKQTRAYQAGTGATRGLLVYVDREGQNFLRIFTVKPDGDDVKQAVQDLVALREGPEPGKVGPTATRNKNKGADSFALDVPWQVGWCNDLECPCKKAMPSFPTGRVIAKEGKNGGIIATDEKYDTLIPLLQELLT
jgi:hypothetical protein